MQADEALGIIAQAAAGYHGTRKDHEAIFEAEQILAAFVAQAKELQSNQESQLTPTQQ